MSWPPWRQLLGPARLGHQGGQPYLARQLAFLAAPSGSARAGPIQGVAGGAVEAPAR